MQKAFIFDFDGTLADTIPLTLDAIGGAYKKLGMPVPPIEKIKSTFGAKEQGIFHQISPERETELFEEYISEYCRLAVAEDYKPFDGIENVLKNLKSRGVSMSLVTGKSDETANFSLDMMGLRGYFDFVECGGMKSSIKPEKMRKILDEYDIAPSNVFYVGDSPRDVTDSREVGVRPLAVAWSRIVSPANFAHLMPVDIFESVEHFAEFAYAQIEGRTL